jgi:amidase
LVESGHSLTGAQYAWAQTQVRRHGLALAQYFGSGIDLMLTPTMSILPPRIGALDMMSDDEETYLEILYGTIGFTALFNDTGLPAISLPLATSQAGLPIGMQLVAPMGGESLLLSVAGQIEREGLFQQPG